MDGGKPFHQHPVGQLLVEQYELGQADLRVERHPELRHRVRRQQDVQELRLASSGRTIGPSTLWTFGGVSALISGDAIFFFGG